MISRARRASGYLLSERAKIRADRKSLGIRRAVAARVRANLELDGVTGDWVAEASSQLRQLGPLVPRVDALEHAGERRDASLETLRVDHERTRAEHRGGIRAATTAAAETAASAAAALLAREVLATTAFVRQLPDSDVLVSVLTTTRGRPELLLKAIASVEAQKHQRWELIIAHDAGDVATAEALAQVSDPRVIALDREGRGRSAALELALRRASGDVVTYLDDDNMMTPEWLAAVAWTFSQTPPIDVAYGALARQQEDGPLPFLQLEPWDALRLETENYVDQNVIAHRRQLPEARFDEELPCLQDWDLLLRLTADTTPHRIPVLAAAYRSDAPNRLSRNPRQAETAQVIRRRTAARRPLRVLGSNAMFPLISETYIADELEALAECGAELAYHRETMGVSPMAVPRPVYDDFDEAIAEFRPDVVILHWAHVALQSLPRLEAVGLPFGVRVHSFDHNPETIQTLLAHPQCIGVWSYPSHPYQLPGTYALPPIFTSVRDLPPPADQRSGVVSVSAGLPKKDWPLLFEALGQLPGLPRHVVTGVTGGHTHVPGELATMAAEMADPVLVQVNLVRSQVLELLANASVLVYSLRPDVRFGMPMSIIEGLCAGCCVIVPDRPECRDYAGPGFRGYRTADDIARHVLEVERGGPAIEQERIANMEYGRSRFCAPALGATFYEQVHRGVAAYRQVRTGDGRPPAVLAR